MAKPGMEFRYQPRHCALLGKVVWAILTKQEDGGWRIVNCLDKDAACFGLNCAFTTDQGEWPYRAPTSMPTWPRCACQAAICGVTPPRRIAGCWYAVVVVPCSWRPGAAT